MTAYQSSFTSVDRRPHESTVATLVMNGLYSQMLHRIQPRHGIMFTMPVRSGAAEASGAIAAIARVLFGRGDDVCLRVTAPVLPPDHPDAHLLYEVGPRGAILSSRMNHFGRLSSYLIQTAVARPAAQHRGAATMHRTVVHGYRDSMALANVYACRPIQLGRICTVSVHQRARNTLYIDI